MPNNGVQHVAWFALQSYIELQRRAVEIPARLDGSSR